jgi:hypothetical protein
MNATTFSPTIQSLRLSQRCISRMSATTHSLSSSWRSARLRIAMYFWPCRALQDSIVSKSNTSHHALIFCSNHHKVKNLPWSVLSLHRQQHQRHYQLRFTHIAMMLSAFKVLTALLVLSACNLARASDCYEATLEDPHTIVPTIDITGLPESMSCLELYQTYREHCLSAYSSLSVHLSELQAILETSCLYTSRSLTADESDSNTAPSAAPTASSTLQAPLQASRASNVYGSHQSSGLGRGSGFSYSQGSGTKTWTGTSTSVGVGAGSSTRRHYSAGTRSYSSSLLFMFGMSFVASGAIVLSSY